MVRATSSTFATLLFSVSCILFFSEFGSTIVSVEAQHGHHHHHHGGHNHGPAHTEEEKDYYAILGVERDVTAPQLKKVYRKLSLKYHPDKNKGNDEATKKLLEVNEAYEVLSDEDKRQIYDIDGYSGLKQHQQQQAQGGGAMDPFAAMFGGQQQGGRRKGPDARMELTVSLEMLYNGHKQNINFERNVLCSKCRGTGAKDGKTKKCPHCNGQGVTVVLQQIAPGFNVQMQQPCQHCRGKGKTHAETCPVCSGKRIKPETKELHAVIERGMKDGDELKFPRASEQSPDYSPGDVILVLKQQKHPRFERKGDDLHTEIHVTLKEALLGFDKTVVHLDNHLVTVRRRSVTQPHHIEVMDGEGMPQHESPSIKGKMYVKVIVDLPEVLNAEQKAVVDKHL